MLKSRFIVKTAAGITIAALLSACGQKGEAFQILSTGGRNIRKATVQVSGPEGRLESQKTTTGDELPCWRIDDFNASAEGDYKATLTLEGKEVAQLVFKVAPPQSNSTGRSSVEKTTRSWDSAMETLYSAWVNALFKGSDEQTSWSALHEVTQNKDRNFL